MSGTTPPTPTPQAPAPSNRRGTVVVSVVVQTTFLLALVAAAYLYWVTKDAVVLSILSLLAGAAATNATNVVGYWVGSSVGSATKTDIMAANPPPRPPS